MYDVTIHEEGLLRVLLKVQDVLGKDINFNDSENSFTIIKKLHHPSIKLKSIMTKIRWNRCGNK